MKRERYNRKLKGWVWFASAFTLIAILACLALAKPKIEPEVEELIIENKATEQEMVPESSTPTPVPSADKPPAAKPTPIPTSSASTINNTRPTLSPLNKEVSIGKTNSKKIVLTLDAGSGSTQTEAILSVLREKGVHATFFLTGKWAEQNPVLVRKIVEEGHTLGNHTYDHKDLTTLSDDDIRWEFEKTVSVIQGIAPTAEMKPYFRPPYGARNQHVWDFTASLGYQSIYWTVDAWDWKTDATADIVKQRIYNNEKNGAIILMHVGDDITPAVLPEVLSKLQSDGYEVGTLESALQ